MVAKGLVRTDRAALGTTFIPGMMRLECFSGGFYWILLDGSRLLRGPTLLDAEELQPKFMEAIERAGQE